MKVELKSSSFKEWIKIRSPFSGNAYLSRDNLREDVLNLKTSVAKIVLQLSSGTIVLSISIMQYLVAREIFFNKIILIKLSWISLSLSILFGLLYFYYLTSHLVIFPHLKKDEKNSESDAVYPLYFSFVSHMKAEFMQFLLFFFGIVLLGLFTVLNF